MSMSENTPAGPSVKDFLFKNLGKLGVGSVLALVLILYYSSESRRWDERMRSDEARWRDLFAQNREWTSEALRTIEACCNDRLRRLEDIEAGRASRTRRKEP